MGRGRQKAKHIKVARKLKYYSPETDLEALQRELATSGEGRSSAPEEPAVEEESDDWEDDSWSNEYPSYSATWDDLED